ncbi:hypothetical protein BJV78DRAFT_1156807 [Lactifluus subvellereus]|nr:hypothetical protein BJV78DRAFT_1156807 [Lactifluus subvellereus]
MCTSRGAYGQLKGLYYQLSKDTRVTIGRRSKSAIIVVVESSDILNVMNGHAVDGFAARIRTRGETTATLKMHHGLQIQTRPDGGAIGHAHIPTAGRDPNPDRKTSSHGTIFWLSRRLEGRVRPGLLRAMRVKTKTRADTEKRRRKKVMDMRDSKGWIATAAGRLAAWKACGNGQER